ncbi:MAG: saccharopine dehydrogenase NADP-binding domain-containing protein [Gaiellales bacterium]
MRIAVIGGAGGMGRVTVADAARGEGVEEVRIVDRDTGRAERLAAELGGVVTVGTASADLAREIGGVDCVVNAASHMLNVPVMQACLEVGAHYTDLGGLFHFALRQYELDEAFGEAGLAAAISMGSAPGLTNMLAAAGAAVLDTVESVEIVDAFIPGRLQDPDEPYVPPYAAGTIIDEFTADAAQFLDGELRMLPAASGSKVYEFPEGSAECVYTIHSEPATLPRSYADRGIRNVEWRLGLPALDVARLRSFIASGLTSTEPVRVGDDEIVPRDALVAVLMRQAQTVEVEPDPGGVEWFRVFVTGRKGGVEQTVVAEMRVAESQGFEHGAGATVTGVPPSIAAQMLCRGERLRDGVGGPEAMLPVGGFFTELARRGLRGELVGADGTRSPLA